jgi:hypothetical protein
MAPSAVPTIAEFPRAHQACAPSVGSMPVAVTDPGYAASRMTADLRIGRVGNVCVGPPTMLWLRDHTR